MLGVLFAIPAISMAQNSYTKITSASGLEAGAKYIIVGHDDNIGDCAMSYQKSNNRHAVSVTDNGGTITVNPATDPDSQTEVFEFTLGGSNDAWTFFDELKNGYLYAASSSSNQLKTQTTNNANGEWKIEFDADGTAEVTAQGENTRNIMRFNENSSNGAPLFSCYNSGSSINVRVSFYKAGGEPAQPDPEPTNYPTNFTASADKIEITLNWTDATGGQLPSRYLVVGSTGSITVPTDGVPVADGALVRNVAYGVETVTFQELEGNTTYHFAIFPYTNSGANIDYKTSSGYPTAGAQTEDIHVLLKEDFEGADHSFNFYNVYGDQEWVIKSYGGNYFADMNGYDGVAHQNEDWLISPVMDGNFASITLSFATAKKYDGDDLRLMVSSDYDGVSEPSDFNWTNLTDIFDWSSDNFEWTPSGSHNIQAEVGPLFYIAFVYTCDDTAAAHWEVDDVMVIAAGPVSVGEQTAAKLSLSPNPASDVVRFELSQGAQVSVFDLSGRMLSETHMGAGQATLDVSNFENGIYFLSVTYADGKKEVARFVKF